MDRLSWSNETRRLGDLAPWPSNPRQIRKEDAERLAESLDEFGQVQTIAIDPDGEIVDGHQRQNVWGALEKYGPDYTVDVRVASRKLTEKERQKLAVYLHQGAVGEWDFDELANWDVEIAELVAWGFTEDELQLNWGDDGADADADEIAIPEQWMILIECDGEMQQVELLARFEQEGLNCRALLS